MRFKEWLKNEDIKPALPPKIGSPNINNPKPVASADYAKDVVDKSLVGSSPKTMRLAADVGRMSQLPSAKQRTELPKMASKMMSLDKPDAAQTSVPDVAARIRTAAATTNTRPTTNKI
jgi:hypothetical protein